MSPDAPETRSKYPVFIPLEVGRWGEFGQCFELNLGRGLQFCSPGQLAVVWLGAFHKGGNKSRNYGGEGFGEVEGAELESREAGEGAKGFLRRLGAGFGITGDEGHNPRVHSGREVGHDFCDRLDSPGEVGGHHLDGVITIEGFFASEELVGHGAECIEVGAGVEDPVSELFGGHVVDRAPEAILLLLLASLLLALGVTGAAKVDEGVVGNAVRGGGLHEVGGLEVKVADAFVVDGDEGLESLDEEVPHFIVIEGSVSELLLKVGSFDEFKDDKGAVFVVINVVGTDDIGMTNLGNGSYFREVVRFRRGAVDGFLVEALEGNLTINLGVEGAVDVCGCSGADFGKRAVASGDF